MKQPKVYIKELNIVREVEMIDFYNKQVLAYVIGVRPRGETAIYSFDEVEFMENTGMKDKNGKYIYVGDILKFDDEFPTWDYEGEVSACGGFNVAIVTKEKNCITLTNFQADDGGLEEMLCTRELIFDELNFEDYEVISNIYENKELVE
jgi:uncharacterized phage protein (TIGR01671 family)